MRTSGFNSLAVSLIALSIFGAGVARAAAPNACSFLSKDAVSAALGKQVSGGDTSMIDHAGATLASCMYLAAPTVVIFSVDERGTPSVALADYRSELDISQNRAKSTTGTSSEERVTLESGVGEDAFLDEWSSQSMRSLTAVHGSRVYMIGTMGPNTLSYEQLRALMQSALRH